MKFNTLTRRAAAAGAATALTAGALVCLTSTGAEAATSTTTYTCPTGAVGDLHPTIASNVPELDVLTTFAAGQAIDPGLAHVTNHITLPSSEVAAIAPYTDSNSTFGFPDYAASVGPKSIPGNFADLPFSAFTDDGDGNYSADSIGVNKAFTMPAAGSFDVKPPTTFTIHAVTLAGALDVPCTANAAPAKYATITVTKNASVTKASSNSPVPHGTKAVLKAKVTAPNHTPTGTVVFKQGTTKLGSAKLNSKGIAVLKKTLSKGKHKIKAFYGGDGYTSKSASSVITVTQK